VAAAGLGAHAVEGVGEAAVPVGLVAHRVEDGGLVEQQLGELGVEFGDGVGLVEAEGFAGGLGAVAVAVPDLALDVLAAAEQQALGASPATSTSTASGSRKPVR
jgi:hypothetical protein